MGSMDTGKDFPYHLPEELLIPSQQVNGIFFPAIYDMVGQFRFEETKHLQIKGKKAYKEFVANAFEKLQRLNDQLSEVTAVEQDFEAKNLKEIAFDLTCLTKLMISHDEHVAHVRIIQDRCAA